MLDKMLIFLASFQHLSIGKNVICIQCVTSAKLTIRGKLGTCIIQPKSRVMPRPVHVVLVACDVELCSTLCTELCTCSGSTDHSPPPARDPMTTEHPCSAYLTWATPNTAMTCCSSTTLHIGFGSPYVHRSVLHHAWPLLLCHRLSMARQHPHLYIRQLVSSHIIIFLLLHSPVLVRSHSVS